MFEDPTYAERCKAKKIVREIRNNWSVKDTASILGIPYSYVCFIGGMHVQRRKGTSRYYAPIEVVRKVIAWSPK